MKRKASRKKQECVPAPVTNAVEDAAVCNVENTLAAVKFAAVLRAGVTGLTDAECGLLHKMVATGRDHRVMAKAAARMWGDDFDGATAEVAGSSIYRLVLKRLSLSDPYFNPEHSKEFMGEFDGYAVHFLRPEFVYHVSGLGGEKTFAPRFLPQSGMDLEDVVILGDIIDDLQTSYSRMAFARHRQN